MATQLPFQSGFLFDDHHPDLALRSSDGDIFWTHRFRLNAASQNAYDGLLSPHSAGIESSVLFPISSPLLKVVLYTIYGLSLPAASHNLQLSTLLDAISVLKIYGIPLDVFVTPSRPLYEAILADTPTDPMEVFMTAAENKLEALAVASSAHLLDFDLTTITDEMTVRMGVRYFRRIVLLQSGRVDRLKTILSRLPRSRPEHMETCSFAGSKYLEAGWVMAVATMAPELRAGERFSLVNA